MEKFRIFGGCRLSGTVQISGAKNAALPCLAATLLTREPVQLLGLPRVRDILTMEKVLAVLGEHVTHHQGKTVVIMGKAKNTVAPYELVRTMRASVLVLGPLLAARRKAKVALPGGCAIGARPIDFHLEALAKLGAEIRLERGDVVAEAPLGLRGREITFPRITVTGTENLLMAATLARGKTVLKNCAKEPEVVDLAQMLTSMGAQIFGAGTEVIEVEGTSELGSCQHRIIADRIEAGTYLMVALLVGQGVEVKDCIPAHLQAMVDLLLAAGAKLEVHADSIRIPPQEGPLAGFHVVTREYPGFPTDLQAQAVALATQASGQSVVEETIFENRFQHVLELKRLGANIKVEGRRATIFGPTHLQGTTVMASDLRASAALVLAALVAEGETIVDRIYHLDRGYEAMEVKLRALGANIERFNPGPFL